ncbi:hypothetical protein H0H81_010665 [Sphagnurus paluster]|uniref:Sterol regulatory element-binding protein cleavage-activating protein n=1 Tax=Sphagnurus paluster TaxID=117069 RepID=A0A9P7GJ03_9AGAR|nr:hypothetical protein H0H81_010665 [Sphagnurus paluster]
MFDHVNRIVHSFRTLGQRFFLQFGLHCATHQIRIILVSCVVITSLFYPALEIYTSSQPKTLSIIDTFISRSTISEFDAQKDLVDVWSYHGLRIHEDAVSRARCGVGRALRVERLLVQGAEVDSQGALTRQTLLSTLELENRIESLISDTETPCLKRPDGKCFVVSPLLFWNHERDALLSDNNIIETLDASKNISLGGIFITPQMVLARRGSYETHAASKFEFATFLAVTYFFPESDCLGTSEHASWLQLVHRALAQDTEPTLQIQEPTLIALKYDLDLPKPEGWSALSAFIYLAYIGFIAYVAWSVRKMTVVHSRLGVTFTALVEITVDAVGRTSVTLSVKQRIAEGLSRAGTSNTLKVVSYNIILGIIAVFSVGAIRQFCAFAIVVLVAHWFLAHTFFVAVLSIDLQRLELDELLRYDPSTLAPAIPQLSKESSIKKHYTPWQKLVFTIQTLLKGRAAANLSLVMLLAIMGTLYYTTYASTPGDEQSEVSNLQPLTKVPDLSPYRRPSAWYIWKTLNPSLTPLLHLRVEVPNIVTFRSDSNLTDTFKYHRKSRPRFSMQTFRVTLWLLKIMVLPIAATTSALWGLLLYLLKNAELLEAQRNRGEPASLEDPKTLEGEISFSTLPRAFPSDVELIAASKDGNIVISVGLRNEITLWRLDKQIHVSIDARDVLLSSASTSSAIQTLTCVAIDNEGKYCAVGSGAGIIAVWAFHRDHIRPLPLLALDNNSAGVTDIQFSPSGKGQSLLATYQSGIAAKWTLEKGFTATYFTPSRRAPVIKCSLVRVHPLDRFLVAFSLDDGTLEVIETQTVDPLINQDLCVQAGDALSTAAKVDACQTLLGSSLRLVIATATQSGLVTLWDGATGECISVFDDVYGRIDHLRVTPVQCETCHFCGQLPLESISVAFSVDHVVRLFRLYVNDETRRCSCSRHQLRSVSSMDSLGRRSRSNSISSQVGSVSPSIPRARLATTFEASSPFPVSAHGVHSRRASDKDTGRRSFDTLTVPVPFPSGDDYESDSRTPLSPSSFWHDAVLVRVTDIACERGGWGVNGRRLIGVRRKPRSQETSQVRTGGLLKPTSSSSQGLTRATLERWEVWMFDPSVSRLQISMLAALTTQQTSRSFSSSSSTSAPSSTNAFIPRLPFTRVSPILSSPTHALAGFGNTVGILHFSCP